jgi:hypothetical protein
MVIDQLWKKYLKALIGDLKIKPMKRLERAWDYSYSYTTKVAYMSSWRIRFPQVRHLEELLSSEPTFDLIAHEWHKRFKETSKMPVFTDVLEFVYKQEFEKAKRVQ